LGAQKSITGKINSTTNHLVLQTKEKKQHSSFSREEEKYQLQ
jgi:hypothetical protein